MSTPRKGAWSVLVVLLLVSASHVFGAQRIPVTIIDRQNNSGNYTYIVPGYSTATANTSAQCVGSSTVVCNGSTTAAGMTMPAVAGSYQVTGATLSLQLPDGRVAIVNCESKTNYTEWSKPTFYRSCRVPLTNQLYAEFVRDKALLVWSVSLDGQTKQSETYKILAVLDRP